MLTGLTGIDEKIAGLEYADDIMSKPFSYRELLARINVMLRIRSLQHELVVSRSQYQFLYENVPFMYVSVDEERIIRNCNACFTKKNGAAKESIIGKKIETFFSKADYSTLVKFIQSIQPHSISANNPVMTMVPLDPAIVPLSVSVSGVPMGEHNLGYSVEMVLQDISPMMILQREQRDARKQLYLSARLASIGTLASGVAHELNNPLTAILGFSSALMGRISENPQLDKEEFVQYLTIINAQTLRCRDIIENLSKFARETDARIGPFRIQECVMGALKLIMPKAAKKKITITSDIPDSIMATADQQKLEQVLIHVINNSIDFCKEGSLVNITVEGNSRFVELSIADNGPGIEADIVPKVFDPFFTTKKVGEGAGLGLAISHHIMEECNGTIEISSEIGKGTKVTLEIPA
jgi:PAS domain S-box-containing protein